MDEGRRGHGRRAPIELSHILESIPHASDVLWKEMCLSIKEKIDRGQGLRIPRVARFTWMKRSRKPRKICVFETVFTRAGLRAKAFNRPEEMPCSDLNFVRLATRIGIGKDVCMDALGHAFSYIRGLAGQGRSLEILFEGVGVMWSKSRSIGFRFFQDEREAKLYQSKRTDVGAHHDQFGVEGKTVDTTIQRTPSTDDVETPAPRHQEEKPQSNDMDTQRDRRASGDADALLNSLRRNKDEDNKRDALPNILPAFMIPCGENVGRKDERAKAYAKAAVDRAYGRFRDAISAEAQRLATKNDAIRKRLQQADIFTHRRYDADRHHQASYAKSLLAQAFAKKERENAQNHERRHVSHSDPSRAMPQARRRNRRDEIMLKQRVKEVLDRQVEERRRRAVQNRRQQIAEDNFFLRCVHDQMIRESQSAVDAKRRRNEELKREWERQIQINRERREVLKAESLTS